MSAVLRLNLRSDLRADLHCAITAPYAHLSLLALSATRTIATFTAIVSAMAATARPEEAYEATYGRGARELEQQHEETAHVARRWCLSSKQQISA